jgi:UDP-glucose 4-epimerase
MESLVTGGAGFIGSHLCEQLLARGDSVAVTDDLSTGSLKNLSNINDHPRFRFFQGSVTDRELVARCVSECDRIFHLAAAVGVKLVIESPLHALLVNTLGAHNVLAEAAARGKKVFVASSSEIYGKSEKERFAEDDDRIVGATTVSRWGYSTTKALDELLALAYFREKGLSVVIGRFFNICGPRQVGRYGMVVPRFVTAALRGEPIPVYSDGHQTRSFLYVDDAIDVTMRVMEEPSCVGQVFNIGSGEKITILELAEKVKRLTRSNSPIQFIPYRQAYDEGFEDMRYRVPDISRLKKAIGFTPRYGIDEILSRTIEHLKKEMANEQ